MAEWLGTGLQNRLQQFDSAWYLKKSDFPAEAALLLLYVGCITAPLFHP